MSAKRELKLMITSIGSELLILPDFRLYNFTKYIVSKWTKTYYVAVVIFFSQWFYICLLGFAKHQRSISTNQIHSLKVKDFFT